MFRGVFNLVQLFERQDLLSELLPSHSNQVDRPPFQRSHEPLGSLLLVLKELCYILHIHFAIPNQHGLFLTEYLAQLASFLEDDIIIFQYLEAMFLILRKREPNCAFLALMKSEESLGVVILIICLSGVPGCCIRDELEAYSLVIIIIALIKGVVGKPLETKAIEFVCFKAASVNASIR